MFWYWAVCGLKADVFFVFYLSFLQVEIFKPFGKYFHNTYLKCILQTSNNHYAPAVRVSEHIQAVNILEQLTSALGQKQNTRQHLSQSADIAPKHETKQMTTPQAKSSQGDNTQTVISITHRYELETGITMSCFCSTPCSLVLIFIHSTANHTPTADLHPAHHAETSWYLVSRTTSGRRASM